MGTAACSGCKEPAVKELYEKKIAADEGLSLYQRRNKAYAMRVSRAPEIYKDQEYQAWERNAEAMVCNLFITPDQLYGKNS